MSGLSAEDREELRGAVESDEAEFSRATLACRAVEQIVARHVTAALTEAAGSIDTEYAEWHALGGSRVPEFHSSAWFVQRSYESAARIVRGRIKRGAE